MDGRTGWHVGVYEPVHASASNVARNAPGMWPVFTISEPTVTALKDKLNSAGYCSSDQYSVLVEAPNGWFVKAEDRLVQPEVDEQQSERPRINVRIEPEPASWLFWSKMDFSFFRTAIASIAACLTSHLCGCTSTCLDKKTD